MFEPIGSRIVVYPDAVKDVTEGGLIIPDAAQEKPLEGVVIFSGPDVKQVRVNDRVLYTRFTGSEAVIPTCDRPVLIMREEDVLVVCRQERETLP
jgi:chaperonin GroES